MSFRTRVQTEWNDPETDRRFAVPAGTLCERVNLDAVRDQLDREQFGKDFKRSAKERRDLVLVNLAGRVRIIDAALLEGPAPRGGTP